MKLGARIFKTGLAIVLALFLADLFQLPHPVFAGIAAIFALQPSIYRSYLRILEQIQGNIIGAAVAIAFVLLFGHQLIAIGLAAVATILIMNRLGLEKSITMALVMMIAIMEIQSDNFFSFALIRFLTILIGVFAAFFVNLVFMPPKYETKLFQTIHSSQDELIRWTRLAGRQASEHIATKNSVKMLKERIIDMEQMYLLFKEERGYFKKATREKARKLVIYRQMISTFRSGHHVLERLYKYENEITQLPEHFRMMIQERVDILLTYHEQLHLKFVGKIKTDTVGIPLGDDYVQRQEVMEIFAKEMALTKEEEEFSAYHLLHVLSAILNYEEQLEHLDLLIVSFLKHHSNEVSDELIEEIY